MREMNVEQNWLAPWSAQQPMQIVDPKMPGGSLGSRQLD